MLALLNAVDVYALPYVPVFNVWLLNVNVLAFQFAVNVIVLALTKAKLLKYVWVSPFTGVLALLHAVVALEEPYLALVVSNVLLAVHPVNVYPLQLGLAILYAVP